MESFATRLVQTTISCGSLLIRNVGIKDSWDYQPPAQDRDRLVVLVQLREEKLILCRFIRSHIPLDDLERRARFPVVRDPLPCSVRCLTIFQVDFLGRPQTATATHHGAAGAMGE